MSRAEQNIAAYSSGQDNAGMSLIEDIWADLDSAMNRLKDPVVDALGEELVFLKGEATGLAKALARLTQNPYKPINIDAVRHEAVERWEQRQERIHATVEKDECATCEEEVEVRVDEAYEPGTFNVHQCVVFES